MEFSYLVMEMAQECVQLRKVYHETLIQKTALAAKLARKPTVGHRKTLRDTEVKLAQIEQQVLGLHANIAEELGLQPGSLLTVSHNSDALFEFRSLEIGDVNGTVAVHLKGVMTQSNIERVFTYMNAGNTEFNVISYA